MRVENGKKGHHAVLILLAGLVVYVLAPAFGVGVYRNGSGQVFFDLWYLIGFMVLAFFLMHELITPLPPKEERTAPGKKSGRAGSGRTSFLTPAETTGGR